MTGGWRRFAGWALWLVLVAAGGSTTRQRVKVWSSDLTLWTDAVRVSPRLPQARVNLVSAYLDQHWWNQAAAEDWRALLVAEDRPDAPVVRKFVAAQLRWMSLFIHLCDRPEWVSRCSSS